MIRLALLADQLYDCVVQSGGEESFHETAFSTLFSATTSTTKKRGWDLYVILYIVATRYRKPSLTGVLKSHPACVALNHSIGQQTNFPMETCGWLHLSTSISATAIPL